MSLEGISKEIQTYGGTEMVTATFQHQFIGLLQVGLALPLFTCFSYAVRHFAQRIWVKGQLAMVVLKRCGTRQ
jgi:hypothetical protein